MSKFIQIFCLLVSCPSMGVTTDLYPLKVGYAWTYEVRKFGPFYPCKDGKEVVRISALEIVQGLPAYKYETCGASAHARRSGEEILIYFGLEKSWIVYLGAPINGLKWHEFRCESHWEAIGTYDTPLGRLKNCFKKTRHVSYTHIEIFCDQVGLVYDLMRDIVGNGWERLLVKKNF